jgi:hypothetical protein
MLRIVEEAAADLEAKFGLRFPRPANCMVVAPGTADHLFAGTRGFACRDLVFVAPPERHLSDLGQTAAHELAHALAASLGRRRCSFLAEGFACYGAAVIDADRRPMGMPLHYHLAWLLSVGVRPRLADLWERRDYTAEMYDLAWSFASFLSKQFGRDRYVAFYRSEEADVARRVQETFGTPIGLLEREWHDAARAHVKIDPGRIPHLDRAAGVLCSRAAWLRKQAAKSRKLPRPKDV